MHFAFWLRWVPIVLATTATAGLIVVGFRRSWLRWSSLRWVILGALVTVFMLWLLPIWLTRQPAIADHAARQKAIADTRSSSANVLVAAGAVLGVLYTARTFDLSARTHELTRTGQVTDRYATAIEQLGNNNRDVRLGGIYALERIMRDSPEDQATIVEVLSAFIREHSPWNKQNQGTEERTGQNLWLPVDVQAVLTVIGRRPRVDKDVFFDGTRRIDLRNSDLRGAELHGAHLEYAHLWESHLEKAVLGGTHLEHAYLSHAHLEYAILLGAHLEHASLEQAHLEKADLWETHLEKAVLWGAHLEGANLLDAHLEHAYLFHAHLEKADLKGAHLNSGALTARQLAVAYNVDHIVWYDDEGDGYSVVDVRDTATDSSTDPGRNVQMGEPHRGDR